MNSIVLKENRRHGDILLPISNYYLEVHNSSIIRGCHWHNEFELFRIAKGKAVFQIGSAFFEVAEGDLLFINSGELHAALALDNADCTYRAVVFSPDMLRAPANDQIQMQYIEPVLSGSLVLHNHIRQRDEHEMRIQKYFDELYRLIDERPPAYELLLKAYLFLTFGELVQCSPCDRRQQPARKDMENMETIKSVIDFIQNNYRENITIPMLADRCNISPGHFCRLFKKYTMKTPIQYINYYRLTKATELLKTTDRKILDVALDTGFNSLSYFIDVFHDSIGVSPSDYRRQTQRT